MTQLILEGNDKLDKLTKYIREVGITSLMLVCGNSIKRLSINDYFIELPHRINIEVVRFSEFSPNPVYDDVMLGVKVFKENRCDGIAAVGGGSAIDVAKCIKKYAQGETGIPLIAMPTTAGTGSESTRFAVIYKQGEKQSVSGDALLPDVIVFDGEAVLSLPLYHKKATMMDAFCHAIESFWSVNSTEESLELSKTAIRQILDSYEGYLNGDADCTMKMLHAANTAGRAINITKTTAGHAMCYKLTSLYGYAHGHSAALCVNELWKWMIDNTDLCIDPRGEEYLREVFNAMSAAMGVENPKEAADKFSRILEQLELEHPNISDQDYQVLVDSVNLERLKNNPVRLDSVSINYLYHEMAR